VDKTSPQWISISNDLLLLMQKTSDALKGFLSAFEGTVLSRRTYYYNRNPHNAMKKISVLTALFMFSFVYIPSIAQDVKKDVKKIKKEEQYQDLLRLINTQQYAFRGDKALPQSGPQIDLTTRDNFLRIDGENAVAYLPYFGRAYSAGYSSGDGGVEFDGPVETFDVNKNDKKRRITIDFEVKGSDDTFRCTLTVSGNRSASLTVISNKRQAIRYTGVISELAEEKSQAE
jgi:hypothetical protein